MALGSDILGGLGSSVAGVVTAPFDMALSTFYNNQQVNSQYELMDHQQKLNNASQLEQFLRENEEYRKRNLPWNTSTWEDYGYNPSVLLGLGSSGSALSGNVNSPVVPQVGSHPVSSPPPSLSQSIDALQHAKLTPYEQRLKEAQSEKEVTQANVNEADAQLKSIEGKVQEFVLDKHLPQQVKESIARVEQLISSTALADADTKLRTLQSASEILKQGYVHAQTDEVRERIRLLDKEIKNYDANAQAQRTAQYASAYESKSNAELNTSKRLSTDLDREIRTAVKDSEIFRDMSENERQALDNLLNQQLIQDYLTMRSNKAGRITDDVLQYLKNLVGGIVSGNVVIPVMPKQKKMGKIGF